MKKFIKTIITTILIATTIPTITIAKEDNKDTTHNKPLLLFTYVQNRNGNIIQEFQDGSWKVFNVKDNEFSCGLNNYNIDLEQEQYTFYNMEDMNSFYDINYSKDFIPFELF